MHAGHKFVSEGDLRVDEAHVDQAVEILGPGEGAGDAADVGTSFGAVRWAELVALKPPLAWTDGTSGSACEHKLRATSAACYASVQLRHFDAWQFVWSLIQAFGQPHAKLLS